MLKEISSWYGARKLIIGIINALGHCKEENSMEEVCSVV